MATGTGETCELPRIVGGQGPRKWSMKRDRRGYRTYSITHRVEVNRELHGPLAVLTETPGLPEPGAIWTEPADFDQWAFFTPEIDIVQVGREADNLFFDVTQTATNDPTDECSEEGKNDPLSIADRVRIESVDYQKEITEDIYGEAVVNSAWEQYRGPQVEFDANRLRVVVEQNAGNLELPLLDSLLHSVNDQPLWGFDAGTVKFSHFDAEPKYHTNCEKYYLRKFVFDIDSEGWIRNLLDEGTKVLHGRWDQKTGTGCTLNISVNGAGAVTNATLDNGGSGYPPSCIVPLKINPPPGLFSGTRAVVLVETDNSGTVTSFVRVHIAGSGYTAGVSNTTQRGQWVLLRFGGKADGVVPDPNNPQHFDRPGDIKGQNTRFILDGKGLPIADDEDAGTIPIEYYPPNNLLLLGIPLSLEIP